MLRISMILSCIVMTRADDVLHQTNQIVDSTGTTSSTAATATSSPTSTTAAGTATTSKTGNGRDGYAVTCYICVNVSDNLICNQYAIDRPCKPGETFCHTLHIMDSKGTSVLVNKKCTSAKECQKNKVGCVEIDTQLMCVSCCDQDYCNVNVPTNASTAIYDDKITKMRTIAKNLFNTEREKALSTTTIKSSAARRHSLTMATLSIIVITMS